jgi:hypothetical protein
MVCVPEQNDKVMERVLEHTRLVKWNNYVH